MFHRFIVMFQSHRKGETQTSYTENKGKTDQKYDVILISVIFVFLLLESSAVIHLT